MSPVRHHPRRQPAQPQRLMPEVLRDHPQFRLFFFGQALSQIGDRITIVALPFAVLATGAGPAEVGLVVAATTLPFLLFSLVAGVIADRTSRRTLMLGSDVVRLVCQLAAGLLLVTDAAHWGHLALIGLVYGTADAFFQPAIYGLMPELVPAAQLQQANALRGLVDSSGLVVGPAVAGLLSSASARAARCWWTRRRSPSAIAFLHAPAPGGGGRRGGGRRGRARPARRPARGLARGPQPLVGDGDAGRPRRLPRDRAAVGVRARAGAGRPRARRRRRLGRDHGGVRGGLGRRAAAAAALAPARAPCRASAACLLVRVLPGGDHRQRPAGAGDRGARGRLGGLRDGLLHAVGDLDPGADPRARRLARRLLRPVRVDRAAAGRDGDRRAAQRGDRAAGDADRDERASASRSGRRVLAVPSVRAVAPP